MFVRSRSRISIWTARVLDTALLCITTMVRVKPCSRSRAHFSPLRRRFLTLSPLVPHQRHEQQHYAGDEHEHRDQWRQSNQLTQRSQVTDDLLRHYDPLVNPHYGDEHPRYVLVQPATEQYVLSFKNIFC